MFVVCCCVHVYFINIYTCINKYFFITLIMVDVIIVCPAHECIFLLFFIDYLN